QAREGGNEEKIMVDYLMIVAGIEAINIIDKDKNLLFLFTQIRVIVAELRFGVKTQAGLIARAGLHAAMKATGLEIPGFPFFEKIVEGVQFIDESGIRPKAMAQSATGIESPAS
ncbi:MAG TPA: hypothetical protein PKV38_12715, partial [bacterium]|nr:hypothetical protein [bacterium]